MFGMGLLRSESQRGADVDEALDTFQGSNLDLELWWWDSTCQATRQVYEAAKAAARHRLLSRVEGLAEAQRRDKLASSRGQLDEGSDVGSTNYVTSACKHSAPSRW